MEKHRKKIEEYAVSMEKMGLTPVAARVFVYLLFGKEPGATFEDLVSYFKVSKSAVSNALKMMSSVNMVESKTIGGQRKRYFFVNFSSMFNEAYMTNKMRVFAHMLSDIKKLRSKEDAFSQELDNTALLYNMLLVELPIMLERWQRTIDLKKKQD